MRAFAAVLRRELLLSVRIGGSGGNALGFFLVLISLVPFGIGPEPGILARISAGILWVGALLATLLSLDRLFQSDWEDGGIDLLMLAPLPLEAVVLAKSLAHWLTTGLPLVVVAPVLGLMLNLPPARMGAMAAALAIGTPTLSLIGAVGAALTAGVRRGGLLLSLLVLPLYIPVLVFGVAAVAPAGADGSGAAFLALAALALFALVLAPVAAAAALRGQML